MDPFLTNENIEMLYNLLGDTMMQKFKINISDDYNSLTLLKNNMNNTLNTTPIKNSIKNEDKIIILSKKVLDNMIKIYTQNKTEKHHQNVISRNLESLDIKNNNIVDERPLPSGTEHNKTLNTFNHLQEIRKKDMTMPKKKNIDFTEKYDESKSVQSNVSNKYEQLMQERELNFLDNDNVNKNEDTSLINKLSLEDSQNSDDLLVKHKFGEQFTLIKDSHTKESSYASQFDSNNKIETDIKSKDLPNENIDYNDLLKSQDLPNKNNESFTSSLVESANINNFTSPFQDTQSSIIESSPIESSPIESSLIESSPIESSSIFRSNNTHDENEYFPLLKKPRQDIKDQDEYKFKVYNLIINSADRKWYGDYNKDGTKTYDSAYTKRYKYSIIFAPESDNTFKIPIYENNEFIPLDINNSEQKLKILKGERTLNTSGFVFNGRTYNGFIKESPNGNIIDYEFGISKGNNDSINIDKRFRNVVSVRLKRIILPNIDEYLYNDSERQIYIGCKTEPYLLVNVDEFNSNIVSSSIYNKNIFCKVIYSTEYSFIEKDLAIAQGTEITETRGFIHLIDEDNDYKQFYPSPLSELNKITFSLMRPDGTLYSEIEDNLEVINLKQEDNKKYMTLTLNQNVDAHYFKQSDKIIIKNFMCKDTTKTLPPAILSYLEKGAYIYKRSLDISNQVYISHNVSSRREESSGTDTTDNYYSGYNELLVDSSTDDWFEGIDIKGFIMNISHQHSLIIEVKTKEIDSMSKIEPEII